MKNSYGCVMHGSAVRGPRGASSSYLNSNGDGCPTEASAGSVETLVVQKYSEDPLSNEHRDGNPCSTHIYISGYMSRSRIYRASFLGRRSLEPGGDYFVLVVAASRILLLLCIDRVAQVAANGRCCYAWDSSSIVRVRGEFLH